MSSTNVQNQKKVGDNPTSACAQTIPTERDVKIPPERSNWGPAQIDIELGNIELIVSSCELGEDGILRDAQENPIIKMENKSYNKVKNNKMKREKGQNIVNKSQVINSQVQEIR